MDTHRRHIDITMSDESTSIVDRLASAVRKTVRPAKEVELDEKETAAEEARIKSPMNKLVEGSPVPPKVGALVEGTVSYTHLDVYKRQYLTY